MKNWSLGHEWSEQSDGSVNRHGGGWETNDLGGSVCSTGALILFGDREHGEKMGSSKSPTGSGWSVETECFESANASTDACVLQVKASFIV